MLGIAACCAAFFVALAGAYYKNYVVRRPRVFHHPDARYLLEACPSLTKPFWVTPWCTNGHMSTIVSALLREYPARVSYRREVLPLTDGGQVALDWTNEECSSDNAIALVMPGLTSSSAEGYVRWMIQSLSEDGYRCVVFNNRGCGNLPLSTPLGYSAAATSDLGSVVAHIRRAFPHAPLFAVGFSLGSVILVKYIAEQGATCELSGAISISNPWDFHKASESLEKPLARTLFNYRLADNLKSMMHSNRHVYGDSGVCDWEALRLARIIRDIDRSVICPMFNYSSVEEYYNDAQSEQYLPRICIPTVFLNAADDPFSPLHGIPCTAISRNPNTLLSLTPYGGHLSFAEGLRPLGDTRMESIASEVFAALRHLHKSV